MWVGGLYLQAIRQLGCRAAEKAGLVQGTVQLKDCTRYGLVQYMMDAVNCKECNPKSKRPNREILTRYGIKVGWRYTHYHYEKFFGSISQCWNLIVKFYDGEIDENTLLSGPGFNPSPGLLYLVKSNDEYTIGKTKNIKSRMKGYRTHNPQAILLGSRKVSDMDAEEKKLHKQLQAYRAGRTEWFKLEGEGAVLAEEYFRVSLAD